MIKILPKFFSLLIILLFFVLYSNPVYATTFEDNFDDGDINNWITVYDPDRTPCSSPWETKEGMVGIKINQNSCSTNLMPDDSLWGDLGNNYIIEVDMKFVAGTDHNIAFRFTPGIEKNYWYDIHFMSPGGLALERVPPGITGNSVNYPIPNKESFYHLKIIMETGNVKIYIDDVLVLDYIYDPIDEKFPTGKVALRAGAGADPISETWFDNLVVTSIDEPPPPLEESVPVVVVPGFGGSWNTEDIISGESGGAWKKTPYIKVYDNLKATFIDNAEYIEGDDYFEFYYDWRKPLNDLSDDLKNYLETVVLDDKDPDTKVNLIGHSMGGLVARSYAQKYGIDKINKLVTTGSPHEGAISAWQGWAGAEIGDRWSWQWIGSQLYLNLHKGKYASPTAAVHDLMPGLNNLMPIFDFTKDENNQVIDINSMDSFNNYLQGLKNSLGSDLKSLMNIIAGHEDNLDRDSIEWVKLGERSLADKLLGRWPDGKPIDFEYTSEGDLTVLDKSALIDEVSQLIVDNSHIQLVETEAGIEAILKALEVEVMPITNTTQPIRNPSLFFFLHSPANIRVTAPNGQAGHEVSSPIANSIYSPEDKLLVIYDALKGNYEVKVIGESDGTFNLDIGQLIEEGEYWQTTKESIVDGEIKSFDLIFNPDEPQKMPIVDETGKFYLSQAKLRLEKLIAYINKQEMFRITKRQLTQYLNRLIRLTDKAINLADNGNYFRAFQYSKAVMAGSYSFRLKIDRTRLTEETKAYINDEANEIGQLLLEASVMVDNQVSKKLKQKMVDRYVAATNKLENIITRKLKRNAKENHLAGLTYELAQESLAKANGSKDKGEFMRAYLNAQVSRLEFLEVLRLIR